GALKGKEINEAKKILAYEVTKLAHGEEEATAAAKTAEALFHGRGEEKELPTTELEAAAYPQGIPLLELLVATGLGQKGNTLRVSGRLQQGIPLLELLVATGLVPSKKEARRLIDQRGIA